MILASNFRTKYSTFNTIVRTEEKLENLLAQNENTLNKAREHARQYQAQREEMQRLISVSKLDLINRLFLGVDCLQ